MRISRQADYAVRAVLHLSLVNSRARVTRAEIAEAQEIPLAFLTKILNRLAAAGLVDLRRGVKGGVKLAKAPAEISLADVIETVDGPLTLNRCLIRPHECPRDHFCAVHPLWRQLTKELRARLAGIDFAALARRQLKRRPKRRQAPPSV